MKDNIILVGMPGAGKSTIGVILAKVLGYQFLDSDLVIQDRQNKLLKDIIKDEGVEGFIDIENKINTSICVDKTIIATGGSAIYGNEAMEHFRSIGKVVYIKLNFDILNKRLGDIKQRGVVLKDGQTLKELYYDRCPLYEKYADLTIDASGLGIEELVEVIENQI